MQMNSKPRFHWLSWPLLLAVIFLPLAMAAPPNKEPAESPSAGEPAKHVTIESQLPTPVMQLPPTPTPSQPVPLKRGPTKNQPGFTPTEKIGADAAVSFPVDI